VKGVKITFFMIVTDPDIVIADYSVKSYARIKDIPFKLIVYSNWISSGLKQRYFPAWRNFEFVEIVENEWQADDNRPKGPNLEGPFELYDTIWDRELRKIQTPFHATVDADFEILDARFISVMVAQLEANPHLVAMSTDYSPRDPMRYDSYSNEVICLNERWHTWFCIYKREALRCPVSYAYYEELGTGAVRRNAWDSAAYFQHALMEFYGYELAVLPPQYQLCFIHYGAFSKNRHIDETNIGLYRQLQILRKRGLFGTGDIFTRKLATMLSKIIFGRVDRSRFWEGWQRA